MPAKKRQNDPKTGKKNKKEKRGELAVINSDFSDESVQKGMRDAWQRKESYTNGMFVHPRDTVSLHEFKSLLNGYSSKKRAESVCFLQMKETGLCVPGNIHLDCEPFSHCRITHFLQSESFVGSLQEELLQLNFNSKSNDLYKFQQVSVWNVCVCVCVCIYIYIWSENWVLNSVSSAVRWSEREKRTSYLTNKVRQCSNELLR